MFKRLLINLSYFLSTSKRYQNTKRFFYNVLENDNYKYKKYFDIFMIILILTSVMILIREVKAEVPESVKFFNNYVISLIFLIEYILRLWVDSSVSRIIIERSEHDAMLDKNFNLSRALTEILQIKFKYMISIKAIIDLLAIMPFFHELRLLRVFVLFRVFKLFRYAKSLQTFASVIATKKFEFITLSIFAGIVIFISSVLVYVMEANNPNSPINTIFDALYWAVVTMSTVGFGDIVPITDAGRIVAMFVIISGVAVLAFLTSLVVSAFTEKLDEIRETKTINDITKLKEFYLICGYESVAHELAKKLLASNKNVIVLDEDIGRIELAKKNGLVALNYDPGSVDSYKNLRIDINTQVKSVLCLRESDVENVYTALTVRSMDKEVQILSLLMDSMNRKKLEFAGVNEILYAKEFVGMMAKEFVGQPVAFEAIYTLRSDHTNIGVDEIFFNLRMASNFAFVGELNNSRFRLVLLGIFKKEANRFFFNPIDSTLLEEGDYLVLIGNPVFIKEFENYLNTKKIQ